MMRIDTSDVERAVRELSQMSDRVAPALARAVNTAGNKVADDVAAMIAERRRLSQNEMRAAMVVTPATPSALTFDCDPAPALLREVTRVYPQRGFMRLPTRGGRPSLQWWRYGSSVDIERAGSEELKEAVDEEIKDALKQ